MFYRKGPLHGWYNKIFISPSPNDQPVVVVVAVAAARFSFSFSHSVGVIGFYPNHANQEQQAVNPWNVEL
jgi:hypothetical protein